MPSDAQVPRGERTTTDFGVPEPDGDPGLTLPTHPAHWAKPRQPLALLLSLPPGLGPSAKSKKLLGQVPGINYKWLEMKAV